MRITFLGTGNAFAPQRDWECILVNEAIVLDAGPSLLVNLKRAQCDPTRINHIFISHFHGDHFFGLPFLLLEYYFISRTDAPLAIIGPAGIEEKVRRAMMLAYPDIMQGGWPRPMTFVEAIPGTIQTANGVTFSAVEVAHIPNYPAYGYRLHLDEAILAYSGDTGMSESIYTLIDGARVVILEAASQEVSAVHLGREALREVMAKLPQDCAVFLSHLDTPGAEPWREFNAVIPNDLASYTISFPTDRVPEVAHG